VRLYLSSFRVGAHPDRLLSLASGRRTAVVANAMDSQPVAERAIGVQQEFSDLGALGLDVAELDLRQPEVTSQLAGFDIVWVRGGNVFVLRRVLADSGADDVLIDLIRRNAIVYAGYSAGACVLTPDLAGLERVDDIKVVANPLTTGLALLDRPFVPHVRSPGHPETATCDALAAAYAKAGRPHWALRDGEVLVVENCDLEVLS
jgi:dipeptidase E